MAKPTLNYYETMQVAKVKTDVVQYTTITDAIAAITARGAPAAGKRWAVYVHPGTYTEKVTMVNYVDVIAIGGRQETVITNQETAGGSDNAPTVTGADAMIKGFTIESDGTNKIPRCVQNATDGFEIDDCVLDVTVHKAGDIALNAINSFDIRNSVVDSAARADTAVSLDVATEIYNIDDCKIGGGITSLLVTTCLTLTITRSTLYNLLNHDACATSTIARDTIFEEIDFDGGTLFELRECYVESIAANTGGTVVAYGGTIRLCNILVTATSFVWWLNDHLIRVIPNMLIAHALAVAVDGDTVMVGQGTWAESNLAPATGVDIVGEGWGLSIISTTSANPIIAVGDNIICELHGLTIRNTGAGGAIHIETVGSGSDLTLEDCRVTNSGAGDAVVASIGGAGLIALTARRCNLDGNAAWSIVVLTQTAGAGLLFFNSWDCQFGLCGGATNAAIEASAANVADVNVYRAVFTTDCGSALYCANANHTVDIEDSEFNNAVVGIANPSVVNLTKCNNIGIFSHAAACIVTLRECYLSNTYTIGAVAGVVNAYRTQFSTFTNGGSGAIAFEECNGTNINNNDISTMIIEGGHWDTVLQGVAAGTINIREAVIATELDCSAGGAINAYNCQVADIDSNGGTITLYEGDLRLVSTAIVGVVVWWEAPHQLRVISSTANMKIMDAADAAAAGDTILIGPGTFTEALDLDAAGNACTYKGFGVDKTIITQANATVVKVNNRTGVVLEDLTIQLTAGDNDATLDVDATTAAAGVILRNAVISAAWAANTVYGVYAHDGGGFVATVAAYGCIISATGGANSYAVAANTCTTATSSISLYACILNGTTYDIYNDRITIATHKCELNGAGWWIQNNATAIGLAMDNENPDTVTPVTFAGAAGEFADLTGAELYTCAATVLIGEAVYVSAANTVVEATNAAATPIPAEGIVVYKPGGAGGTTCFVKNSGMAYMSNPAPAWIAGTNVWLGVAGAQLVARPTNALKQLLGVGVDTKRMLVNIASVEVVTEWLSIPLAWGAGSAPTGTHTDGNSRRAVAIATAAQTVFSQAVAIPENFLAFSKLYVSVFPNGNGSFDWTAYSSAAKSGEDEATNSDTATADGQAVTDDILLDHDISAAADGYTMEERDIFSTELLVDVLTTITQLEVLDFRLEYTAQRGA